ncbi:hypothetical protein [Micromonospora noduli]|nr:hypothetical protein [Micromonospora noduli]
MAEEADTSDRRLDREARVGMPQLPGKPGDAAREQQRVYQPIQGVGNGWLTERNQARFWTAACARLGAVTDDARSLARRGASGAIDLQGFEERLLERIGDLGLPTNDILVPVRQRTNVLSGVEAALEPLDGEQRRDSVYLSKFLAAVAAGLFDAALNYLWDETIGEMRRRVAAYDLAYFFDLAVGPTSDRRKKLSSADDLSKVEDQELVLAANRMGLLSDTGLQQLDLVRYMRNHASAAHPNQVQLRALQLLSYLEVCIAEVMTLQPDDLVVEIKKLLANIKTTKLEAEDAIVIAATFDKLQDEQADNLGNGLFGIYTRLNADDQTRENIRLLLPELWPQLREETRRQFGVKAGRYRINHQQAEYQLARELLDAVDASSYLPDELRSPEIDAALDALVAAHLGYNNFTAEGPPAGQLSLLVGDPPAVPSAIRRKYVKTVVYVFLTNGYGESWAAKSTYKQLIEAFTPSEARHALGLFTDKDIINRLHQDRSDRKFHDLLTMIDKKIVGRTRRLLLDALAAIPKGQLHAAHNDKKIMNLYKEAQRSTRAAV